MATVVKVSSGTASVLGLVDTHLDAPPTTAYLMVGGRCRLDCGFCAQARHSKASAAALSRVNWPTWEEDEVLAAVVERYTSGKIERCCLQVTVNTGHLERVKEIATRIGKRVPLGASVVANATQAGELLESGLERVGLSLDAVNEESFRRVKGGNLPAALRIIEESARRFPGRIVTHLMAGLGESEEEMVRMIAQLREWGVTTALFAFTPVPGTVMEDEHPPTVASYRRIQVCHYLMKQGLAKADDFEFSSRGEIASFGLADDELEAALSDGKAFETSGCPGCNRPYYNEPPSGPLYNYPRSLIRDEVRIAMEAALTRPG